MHIDMAARTEAKHASTLQLVLLFVAALALFTLLRWQPESWLRLQIERLVEQAGIELQYDRLQCDGISVALAGVRLRVPGRPESVSLQRVSLRPAWGALLHGAAAVRVAAIGAAAGGAPALQIAVTLLPGRERIVLREISARLDAAWLRQLLPPQLVLPLAIGGRFMLSGELDLAAADARPQGGELLLQWRQATSALTGGAPLGDYRLTLQGGDAPGRWQWRLDGGSRLTLSGRGRIDVQAADPRQWRISGEARAQVAAALLPGLPAGTPMALTLYGTLGALRLQLQP
jgi:hypothetical protein